MKEYFLRYHTLNLLYCSHPFKTWDLSGAEVPSFELFWKLSLFGVTFMFPQSPHSMHYIYISFCENFLRLQQLVISKIAYFSDLKNAKGGYLLQWQVHWWHLRVSPRHRSQEACQVRLASCFVPNFKHLLSTAWSPRHTPCLRQSGEGSGFSRVLAG